MDTKLRSLKEALDLLFKDHPWQIIRNEVSAKFNNEFRSSSVKIAVKIAVNDGSINRPNVNTIETVTIEYLEFGGSWDDKPVKQFRLHYTLNDEWLLLYE